jgi:ParB-like chromosome segregation protein Spo0J
MTGQLRLLPRQAPSIQHARVPIEQIDGWQHAQPDRELIELVRELGVLQPVLLAPTRSGRYSLIEGRRRTKTIAILSQQDAAQVPEIAALILTDRDAATVTVRAGLTLALHASRSDSPASELAAIEAILKAADDQERAVTVKQIAAQTDMPVQTVQRRLRLQRLTPRLRRAFDHGAITCRSPRPLRD